MKQENNPLRVGIFDSGVGGFSCLNYLQSSQMPLEIVYYADQELFPFGEQSQAVLHSSLLRAFAVLINQQVDCIFLACHTISIIYEQFLIDSPIPIYPISLAGRMLLEENRQKKIMLLGSKSTINSGYYQKYLQSFTPSCEYYEYNAQKLIDAIEKEKSKTQLLSLINEIAFCFQENAMDALFLGCTHFSLIHSLWGDSLNKKILDPHHFLRHSLPFIDLSIPSKQNSYSFLNAQMKEKYLHLVKNKDLISATR